MDFELENLSYNLDFKLVHDEISNSEYMTLAKRNSESLEKFLEFLGDILGCHIKYEIINISGANCSICVSDLDLKYTIRFERSRILTHILTSDYEQISQAEVSHGNAWMIGFIISHNNVTPCECCTVNVSAKLCRPVWTSILRSKNA